MSITINIFEKDTSLEGAQTVSESSIWSTLVLVDKLIRSIALELFHLLQNMNNKHQKLSEICANEQHKPIFDRNQKGVSLQCDDKLRSHREHDRGHIINFNLAVIKPKQILSKSIHLSSFILTNNREYGMV